MFVGDPFAQYWCIDFGLLIVVMVIILLLLRGTVCDLSFLGADLGHGHCLFFPIYTLNSENDSPKTFLERSTYDTFPPPVWCDSP